MAVGGRTDHTDFAGAGHAAVDNIDPDSGCAVFRAKRTDSSLIVFESNVDAAVGVAGNGKRVAVGAAKVILSNSGAIGSVIVHGRHGTGADMLGMSAAGQQCGKRMAAKAIKGGGCAPSRGRCIEVAGDIGTGTVAVTRPGSTIVGCRTAEIRREHEINLVVGVLCCRIMARVVARTIKR